MSEPQSQDGAMRVMVVDDDTDNADFLTTLLKTWGYSARVAYTGSFSLKLAAEFKPEVFLLDLGMRNMDGFRLADNILRHPLLGGSTLIAITGHGDESHRARSKEVGFAHFFVKPVDIMALEAVMHDIDRQRGEMPTGN